MSLASNTWINAFLKTKFQSACLNHQFLSAAKAYAEAVFYAPLERGMAEDCPSVKVQS